MNASLWWARSAPAHTPTLSVASCPPAGQTLASATPALPALPSSPPQQTGCQACWASPQALESCCELTRSLAKRDCLTRAGPSEPAGLGGGQGSEPPSLHGLRFREFAPLDGHGPTSQDAMGHPWVCKSPGGNRVPSGTSEQVAIHRNRVKMPGTCRHFKERDTWTNQHRSVKSVREFIFHVAVD